MTDPSPTSPAGGGCLLAICVILGALLGVVFHQISAGIVGGIVVGAAIAVALWMKDRPRG